VTKRRDKTAIAQQKTSPERSFRGEKARTRKVLHIRFLIDPDLIGLTGAY
jgi:hypothetical protein